MCTAVGGEDLAPVGGGSGGHILLEIQMGSLCPYLWSQESSWLLSQSPQPGTSLRRHGESGFLALSAPSAGATMLFVVQLRWQVCRLRFVPVPVLLFCSLSL